MINMLTVVCCYRSNVALIQDKRVRRNAFGLKVNFQNVSVSSMSFGGKTHVNPTLKFLLGVASSSSGCKGGMTD